MQGPSQHLAPNISVTSITGESEAACAVTGTYVKIATIWRDKNGSLPFWQPARRGSWRLPVPHLVVGQLLQQQTMQMGAE
eukprot:1161554-Pelagomonas_calceolata.AAC.9